MHFLKLNRKKAMIGAVALILALVLSVFAGVTFARFRSEYTGADSARSARGIAEYERGAMELGGMPYAYAEDGDSILCDNLSPGDKLMYRYSVKNNRLDSDGQTVTNEVYLFIRCDFTFRVAAMLESGGNVVQEYLSMAVRNGREVGVVHYVIEGEAFSQIMREGDDSSSDVPANTGTTSWKAIESASSVGAAAVYTQSFGFYFAPSDSAESVSLAFEITLPDQSLTGDEVESMRLYADIDITAEQIIY